MMAPERRALVPHALLLLFVVIEQVIITSPEDIHNDLIRGFTNLSVSYGK